MREVRRVQKLGKSTLAISLPASWTKNVGLKGGDVVVVEDMDDGSLRIAPLSSAEFEKVRNTKIIINKDSSQDILIRSIYALYLLGYDKIEVASGDLLSETHLRSLRNLVKYLIGAEIVEYTPNNLVIQILVDPSRYSAITLIERMINIIKFMIQHVLTSIESRNKQLLNEIIELESELDRLYGLTVRQLVLSQSNKSLTKYLGVKPSLITEYRSVVKSLEDVGDVLAQIASILINVDLSTLDKISVHLDVLRECADTLILIIDRILNILEEPNLTLADNVLDLVSEFNNRLTRYNTLMLKSLGLNEAYVVFRDFIDKLNIISKSLEAVAETAFDISIESSGTLIDISSKS